MGIRCLIALLIGGLAGPGGLRPVQAQDVDAAQAALRSGAYEEARAQYRSRLDGAGGPDAVPYAETFLATGDYEAGLREIDGLLRRAGDDPYLHHARGRILVELGRYEDAEAAFRRAADETPEYGANVLALADLFERTGREGQAQGLYALIYEPYKAGVYRTADDLGIAGQAAARLGEFRDANQAFRTAYQLDATHLRNLYWWAELFREKYNDADAQRTFDEALAVNPNYAPLYVGYARSANGFARQEELAARALELNANSVDALSILAGLRILDGLYDEARTLLDRALAVNPVALEPLAHLAAVHHLQGDSTAYAAVEQRALAVNPAASGFYTILSKDCELKFRYPDAVRFGEQAVLINRRDPAAFAQLGTSLLRIGRSREARRYLEFSFDRDPYNLFVGNTLTLIDEYEDFALRESDHFRVLIHRSEVDVLGPAVLEAAEAAYADLQQRYPYAPAEKVFIEAYNDPDDFAVRVAGVPHLGLLGVSFGDVVAINTPRGQDPGSYNWRRTLWHELVHTVSIGVSNYRLPRWFAEGLAVYEEQRARPDWGREMDLRLFLAFDQDKLLPLDEMDRGFTRPTYPGQILLSYYHASKIIGYIVDAHGFEAVVELLQAFASGANTEAALETVLGQSTDVLDRAFRTRLQAERTALAPILAGLPNPFVEEAEEEPPSLLDRIQGASDNDLLRALREGNEHLRAGDYEAAEASFRRALDLYAGFTEPGNAYQGLAAVYRAQGDTARLEDILTRYLDVSEHGASEARELAALHRSAGDEDAARRYLERSLEVDPYDRTVYDELAGLYESAGRYDAAVQARRAILALNPVDRSAAYYRLALSLEHAGRLADARRATLQALELAPGYREAQRLLLKLVDASEE